jgi:copper ion binding protein
MKTKMFITLLFTMVMGIVCAQDNLQLRIEGMHCDGCAGRIKKALAEVNSISDITVDLEKRTMAMNYDAAEVSPESIKETIAGVAERYKPADYDPEEVITRTAAFKAAQMNCGNCLAKIKKNLGTVKGVLEVDGDVENKSVTVTYDANKVSSDDIKSKFGTFDYTVSRYWSNEIVKYAFYKANNVTKDNASGFEEKLSAEDGILDITVNPKSKDISVSYNTNVMDESGLKDCFTKNDCNIKSVN